MPSTPIRHGDTAPGGRGPPIVYAPPNVVLPLPDGIAVAITP
jgi:hypothetical protein